MIGEIGTWWWRCSGSGGWSESGWGWCRWGIMSWWGSMGWRRVTVVGVYLVWRAGGRGGPELEDPESRNCRRLKQIN